MSIPDHNMKSSSSSSSQNRHDANGNGHASTNDQAGGNTANKRDLTRRIKVQMNANPVCCDCAAPKPTWVSIIVVDNGPQQQQLKVGAFCCYQCAIAHRALGTHICFVRSIGLDNMTERDVLAMENGGNEVVNAYFEASILNSNYYDQYRPSVTDGMSMREQFIREKYELRKFCKRDVQIMPNTPTASTTSKPRSIRKKASSDKSGAATAATSSSSTPSGGNEKNRSSPTSPPPSAPTTAASSQHDQSQRQQPKQSKQRQQHMGHGGSGSKQTRLNRQHQQQNMRKGTPPTNAAANAAAAANESELQKHIDEMNKGPLIYTTSQDEVSELTEEVYSHHDMSSPRKHKSKNAISRLFSLATKRFPSGKKSASKDSYQTTIREDGPASDGGLDSNKEYLNGSEESFSQKPATQSAADAMKNEATVPLSLSSSSNHGTSKKKRSKSKESQLLTRKSSNRKLDKYYLYDEYDDGGGGGDIEQDETEFKSRRRASMSNLPTKQRSSSSSSPPASRARNTRSRSGSPTVFYDESEKYENQRPQSARTFRQSSRSSSHQTGQPKSVDPRRSKKDIFSSSSVESSDMGAGERSRQRRRSSTGNNTSTTHATPTPPTAPSSSRNLITNEDKARLERAKKKRAQKNDPLGRATFHGQPTSYGAKNSSGSSSKNRDGNAHEHQRPASSKELFVRDDSPESPMQTYTVPIKEASSRRRNEPRRATMSMMSDYEREKMTTKPRIKNKDSRSCSPSSDHRWKQELSNDTLTAPPKRHVNHDSMNFSTNSRTLGCDESFVSPSSVGSEMYYHDGSITAVLPSPAVASAASSTGESTEMMRKMNISSIEQANAMTAFLDDLLGPSATGIKDKNGKVIQLDDNIRQKAAAKLAELIQQTAASGGSVNSTNRGTANSVGDCDEDDLSQDVGSVDASTLPSLVNYDESVASTPDTLNPRRKRVIGNGKKASQQRSLSDFLPATSETHATRTDLPTTFPSLQDDHTILSMDSDIHSVDDFRRTDSHSRSHRSSKRGSKPSSSSSRHRSTRSGTADNSLRSQTEEHRERVKQFMMLDGITESQNLVSTPIAKRKGKAGGRSNGASAGHSMRNMHDDVEFDDDDDDFDYSFQKASMKSLPNVPFG